VNQQLKLKMPELNQKLGVELEDGRMLTTRVEDIDATDLLVAPPSDQGVTYLMSVGEQIALEWTTERGLLRGYGRVKDRHGGGVPLIRLELDESSVIQRREYVRVECVMSIDVRVRAVQFTGMTLDLSGAGVRVSVPTLFELEDQALLVLYLPGGRPIEARSSVVRIDGDNIYAFRFVEIDPKEQETLIQFVFQAHRRQFANVRRSA
jgi:c-di-GMP-binding flagellar brake protein YcgR